MRNGVPDGDWFCPSCDAAQGAEGDDGDEEEDEVVSGRGRRRKKKEFVSSSSNSSNSSASSGRMCRKKLPAKAKRRQSSMYRGVSWAKANVASSHPLASACFGCVM
jgi:uncharacterized Zn finger protein (UPF0148 family)